MALATRGVKAQQGSTQPPPPGTQPPAPAAGTVTLAFSGGPQGQTADPQGGHLPDLTASVQNATSAPVQATVFIAIQTAAGAATPFKWFAYAGQAGVTYNSNRSAATVSIPAGGTATIRFGTTWSGNPGDYQNVATLEANGMPTQTFVDSAGFSIVEPVAPASVDVTFSGGPSGQVTDPQGGHLPDLTTTATNSGGQAANVTLSVAVATSGGGATAFKWFAYAGQSVTYNSDRSQVTFALAAGQSVQVRWGTTWSGNEGSYENVATASW